MGVLYDLVQVSHLYAMDLLSFAENKFGLYAVIQCQKLLK